MLKFLFKKRKIQNELIDTIHNEIWLLEEYITKGSFKNLSTAEQNELMARLRVIQNNTTIIHSLNK